MKQVKFRSVLLLLLIVLLGLGLALFCLRYTFRGEAWASFSANGHAYTDGVVITVTVVTTNDVSGNPGYYSFGNLLLDEDQNGSGSDFEPAHTISVDVTQPALASYKPTGINSGSDTRRSTCTVLAPHI